MVSYELEIRHLFSAQPEREQEAVLKATAVRSPLPAGNVVDSSLSSLSSLQGGGSGGGRGAGDISSTMPYTALPHGASP